MNRASSKYAIVIHCSFRSAGFPCENYNFRKPCLIDFIFSFLKYLHGNFNILTGKFENSIRLSCFDSQICILESLSK